MLLSKFWKLYTMNTDETVYASTCSKQRTCVFANCTDNNAIYPLTAQEIADSQQKDQMLLESSKQDGLHSQLVDNIMVLYKISKLVISQNLQYHAVK